MGKSGTAVIGQSGGPTAVINASLAAVVTEAKKLSLCDRVLGMRYGIDGFMGENFINLSALSDETLERVAGTPSSALGSSRHKLQEEDLPRILDVLKKNDIRYFFLIGGNDTMDTIHRITAYCNSQGYELIGVGIPKTVDNDLIGTDHTPGFPSAARSNILNVFQGGILARDMQRVDAFVVYQTIGREAGWLAAATALARQKPEDAPHLIYCPERPFSREQFLSDSEKVLHTCGFLSVVVSEGLCYEDGKPVSASETVDAFDNIEFGAMGGSSVGMNIHSILTKELNLRGEFQITESLIMSAADRIEEGDRLRAAECGSVAVRIAKEGRGGVMVTILRREDASFYTGSIPLKDVALTPRNMPSEMINEEGNGVTDIFLDYMRPLISPLPAFASLMD